MSLLEIGQKAIKNDGAIKNQVEQNKKDIELIKVDVDELKLSNDELKTNIDEIHTKYDILKNKNDEQDGKILEINLKDNEQDNRLTILENQAPTTGGGFRLLETLTLTDYNDVDFNNNDEFILSLEEDDYKEINLPAVKIGIQIKDDRFNSENVKKTQFVKVNINWPFLGASTITKTFIVSSLSFVKTPQNIGILGGIISFGDGATLTGDYISYVNNPNNWVNPTLDIVNIELWGN